MKGIAKMKYTQLNPIDNVAVALESLSKGEKIDLAGGFILPNDVPGGHKFALAAIAAGGDIIKYGVPIGHAVNPVAQGEWVHVHNVKTNLAGEVEYQYQPTPSTKMDVKENIPTFMGYRRQNGKVGIRNEVWIIPTVGCVNRLAERLAEKANAQGLPEGVGPAVAFPHPHGCSQLSTDHENTRRMLANLALHPNAGGVLFVGLGCENNTITEFRQLVESHADRNPNISYMVAQDEEDEFAAGLTAIKNLAAKAAVKRETVPVSELKIGMKCGGSDGLSGITANPLIGMFSDWLVDRGGSTVLTEVPEMFGAEKSLLNRAVDEEVFQRGVDMINDFKQYFQRYGQTIYENPSPGNKAGGITTLEDKSNGCTQKGGSRPIVDVLPYGGVLRKAGVTLLAGPGNDIVTVSALAAAGAHLVLFSTGRGTPLGGPAPVIKLSTNADLAKRKPGWIDFDASPLAAGEEKKSVLERFVALIVETASGKQTKAELQNSHDFAIFKDGVTL